MSTLAEKLAPYSKAIDLRAYRQQVLASNVANADTPNYKARDFDFQSAMKVALSNRPDAGGVAMAVTSSRHIPGSGDVAGRPTLAYRKEVQSAVDGNTVDMDVERSAMAENAMQYEILTTLISDRIRGMRTALSGTQG